jgi:hypothetical protein
MVCASFSSRWIARALVQLLNRRLHARADRCRRFPQSAVAQFFMHNPRHLDVDIDPVQKQP